MLPLQINYFNLRARTEAIYMILEYGNIPYTIENYSFTPESWSIAKNLPLIAPFGQLPSMTLPSREVISESGTILRYVGKLAGVYPQDPIEAAKSDMIVELAQEMYFANPLLVFWPIDSEEYKKNYPIYFEALPSKLKKLEIQLGSKKFFGGDSPLFGDFAIFHILDNIVILKPDALQAFPMIKAFVDNMNSIPAIKNYLMKRPRDAGLPGTFIHLYYHDYTKFSQL